MTRIAQTRQTLISRITGDTCEASWDEFDQIYRPYVYGILNNMGIKSSESEDLAQQVIIKVWKALSREKDKKFDGFRNWLAHITKNCVIDYKRKQMREAKRMEKVAMERELSYIQAIDTSDYERLSEKQWRQYLTHMAMKNIAPMFSGKAIEVFNLCLKGVPDARIAEQLDLQIRTVYRLRSRVKVKLVSEITRLRNELE